MEKWKTEKAFKELEMLEREECKKREEERKIYCRENVDER